MIVANEKCVRGDFGTGGRRAPRLHDAMNVGLAALVLIAMVGTASQGLAYEPTGSLEELYDLELLARLRPDAACKMFSSYDRTGGNNDGFSGKYSKLRVEDGDSVLAEMSGAGCIQRIWLTHSEYKAPGLLERKGEHVRVYVDQKTTPALDIPLADLFGGKLARFPKPLVGEAIGGFTCYVPIPYRDGCKVVVDGTAVRFYQITYNTFSSARGVKSFQLAMNEEEQRQLERAVRVWSRPGDLGVLELDHAERTRWSLVAAEGRHRMVLPPGPRIVRALLLEGRPDELAKLAAARVRVTWDGADAPAIDAPLSYLFGQELNDQPYQSLLVGANDQGWYNLMPMPYRETATVEIVVDEPPQVELVVVTEPLKEWALDTAYLHAAYHEQLPTENGQYYPWLYRTNRRGHYAGTYFVTVGLPGQDKLPYWLEGDERFTVDDELTIHGTGSEDYFNCGWYAVKGRLNRPEGLPLHGFPVYHQGKPSCRAVAYRWHLTDPVPYSRNIRAEIEHGGGRNFPTDYRSTSFYYSDLPCEPDETAPKAVLTAGGFRISAFTGGSIQTQELGSPGDGGWSGGDQLFWTGAKPKDRLELALEVKQSGRYRLEAFFTKAADYAVVQLHLDGEKLGEPIDLFHRGVIRSEPIALGVRDLSEGEHRLTIEIVGANPEALKRHFVGLDDVRLTPVDAP